MIIELVGISVSSEKKQELWKALVWLMSAIQVQRGCLRCQLCEKWPAKDELQMETRWDSKEDLIAHLQSDIYKKMLLLMELSTTAPVLEFLAVVELRGLDLVEAARIPPD